VARLTKKRKEHFLATLRETGIVRRAAAAASPGAHDATRTFRDERDRNEAFSEQWDDALNAAIGDAERALWELGVEGVVEREQFDEAGNLRNRVVRRDVRALQLYLAARVPEYRRAQVVEANIDANAKVETQPKFPNVANLSDEELVQLERLVAKGMGK